MYATEVAINNLIISGNPPTPQADMSIISVRLETVQYGGWEALEVAIDINNADGKKLYLTYPTCETILNYRVDSVREKIASKSLRTFLGEGRTVGKFSGKIVNKQNLKGAIAKVSLIVLEDFLAIATWEAVVNQNLNVGKILATGFVDSFRSIVYEQLGETIKLEDRQALLKTRVAGKVTRRTFTDSIKDYCDLHPEL